MSQKRDLDILVLYVEDEKDVRDIWLLELQKQFPNSVGFSSHEEAIDFLDDGQTPDLAILDRGILKFKDDEIAQPEAGDALYMELIDRDIPVAVLSGDSNLEHKDPYYAHPPLLGLYAKENSALELQQVLEKFKSYREAKAGS